MDNNTINNLKKKISEIRNEIADKSEVVAQLKTHLNSRIDLLNNLKKENEKYQQVEQLSLSILKEEELYKNNEKERKEAQHKYDNDIYSKQQELILLQNETIYLNKLLDDKIKELNRLKENKIVEIKKKQKDKELMSQKEQVENELKRVMKDNKELKNKEINNKNNSHINNENMKNSLLNCKFNDILEKYNYY